MAKNNMVNLDTVILSERGKTDNDEIFIANQSAKAVTECFRDLKEIDKKYDEKFEALSAEKKNRYHEHYSNLVEERKEIYKLLEKSQSPDERKIYLDHYVDIKAKNDALFALAEKDDKELKNELVEFKKNDKNQAIGWKIAAVATPVVEFAIWEGLKALAKWLKK